MPRFTYETMKTCKHLDDLIALGLTSHDIACAFGISANLVNRWLKRGHLPTWTIIAAEGLHHRRKKQQLATHKGARQ